MKHRWRLCIRGCGRDASMPHRRFSAGRLRGGIIGGGRWDAGRWPLEKLESNARKKSRGGRE